MQLEFRRIRQIADLPVDTRTDIALRRQIFQRFAVLPLALFHDGRQEHQPFAFRLRQHIIHHLANGLRRQRNIMVRAARFADAGVQKTQIIVDFGDRAHRRARIMGRGFLLNRNGGRQPFDMIHIRFFHQRQKLPGIGRERFHIAALTLGIERIERQR